MADSKLEIPRDVQSDMHDVIDEFGEKVARGEMVDIHVGPPSSPYNRTDPKTKCTCSRFSERINGVDGGTYVHFWYRPDPDCEYVHLQPLPGSHTIKLP